MPIPKPSEARIVVQHYEDGRAEVLLDGKPITGLIGAQFEHKNGERTVLHLSIIGNAVRLETSTSTLSEARVERRNTTDKG